MVGVMNGIRVLEVASWTYVPTAGAVLKEWGADVIKVEHPETGDPQRGLVTSGLVPAGGVEHMMELPNRGKRSVGLDLSSEKGRELLMRLVAESDVFLTNLLPRARRKLRIDVEDIREANPDIIYARGTASGPRGDEGGKGGYDAATFWARAGIQDAVSPEELDYPVPMPGAAFGDVLGGLTIAGGISAALLHRERTGEAMTVDSSLLSLGAWAMGPMLAASSAYGMERRESYPASKAPNPLVNTYRASDGRDVNLVMLETDRFWPELVAALGRSELANDPRFDSHAKLIENNEACIAELQAAFGQHTFAEIKEILSQVQGVWEPVQTLREVLDDPQMEANGYAADVTDAKGNDFQLVASPVQFDECPNQAERAPGHGEHTDAVLGELGFDMEELLELKMEGVIL